MKTCTKCKVEKELSKFRKRSGTDRYQSWCIECLQSHNREAYDADKPSYLARSASAKQKVLEWYQNLKATTPCADCGSIFPHYVMQFDHLEGFEKTDNVSSMLYRWGRARLLEEIAKCDLLCANCHTIRTWERGQQRRGPQTPVG